LREQGREDPYHFTACATVVIIASEVGAGAVALRLATIGANASATLACCSGRTLNVCRSTDQPREVARERREDPYHKTASAAVVVITIEVRAGAVALRFTTIGANASASRACGSGRTLIEHISSQIKKIL